MAGFRKGFFTRNGMAVDLGTSSVMIYVRSRGIVVREPSVVAVQNVRRTERHVLAVGEEARRMLAVRRPPGSERIEEVLPLQSGAIADYDATAIMLRRLVEIAFGSRRIGVKPDAVICAPFGVTKVEKYAVEDAILQAGAHDAVVVEEPIAAAIGAGLDITRPTGVMVLDIGGGLSETAILSLGGIVASQSTRVAGVYMDEAIVQYVRREFGAQISHATAERLKIGLGSAYPMETAPKVSVRGQDLETKLPTTVEISCHDVYEALHDTCMAIVEMVHQTLEIAPPEISADIMRRGIVMTGGGAQLLALDTLIHNETGLPVRVADQPADAVVLGAGKIVENEQMLSIVQTVRFKDSLKGR